MQKAQLVGWALCFFLDLKRMSSSLGLLRAINQQKNIADS
jgi:hypothetical protein